MSKNNQKKSYLPSIFDEKGKVNVSRFKPKAKELVSMTPAQKQALIGKLKRINKLAKEEIEQDPETVRKQVKEGELNLCEGLK